MAQAERDGVAAPRTVRCQECRRLFDTLGVDGWFLQSASNKVEGDPDGDWVCSDPCLFKIAMSSWMDTVDHRIHQFEQAARAGKDGS